jgi:Mrp family chromosome partitioning ATPase
MEVAETRRIVSAIEHAANRRMPTTLLVTSAAQGEGKSLLAAALAATAARGRQYRVIALDLNWHRPALHRFFDLELEHRCNTIMAGRLTDLVRGAGQAGLDILSAPMDYDASARPSDEIFPAITRLIDQAREAYELVVIDSAAVFPTNRMMIDPVMLSRIVEGVALLILAGRTSRQQVRKAQKTLEAAGANLLGVVTNQWQLSAAAGWGQALAGFNDELSSQTICAGVASASPLGLVGTAPAGALSALCGALRCRVHPIPGILLFQWGAPGRRVQ